MIARIDPGMPLDQARELLACAKGLLPAVADLHHRVICADPYLRHAASEPACNCLARHFMNLSAITRALTAYLDPDRSPA